MAEADDDTEGDPTDIDYVHLLLHVLALVVAVGVVFYFAFVAG